MTKAAQKTAQPGLFGDKAAEPAAKKVTAQAKAKTKKPEPEPPPKRQLTVIKPEPEEPPRNMLAVIARAAADKRVDVAKMKELLLMQRELEQTEQARAFNIAHIAAKAEMPKVARDRVNSHTKSRYATLDKVSSEVDGVLHKHGFSISWGTADSPIVDHYRIVGDLMHEGGHVRRYQIDLPADIAGAKGTSNKTPVQGIGSTISYGRRYLKLMMFDIHVAGEDNDGNRTVEATAVEVLSGPQLEQLVQEAAKVECPEFKLVGFLNGRRGKSVPPIEKLDQLPAARFEEAREAIRLYQPPKGA